MPVIRNNTNTIDYTITSEWNDGYVMEVFVTNDSSDTLNDFEIGFDSDMQVSDMWSADILSQDGNHYIIGDDNGSADLAPGETFRFKFKAEGNEGTPQNFNFEINGDAIEEETISEPAPKPVEDVVEPAPEPTPEPVEETPETSDDGDSIGVPTSISAREFESLVNSADSGSIIRLQSGEYTFDEQIDITRDDISIVGAGSGQTTLRFKDSVFDNDHAIYVDGTSESRVGRLERDSSEGDTTIDLPDGHGLQSGDVIRLFQPNTDEYLDSIGDDAWREMNSPLRTSMARVQEVRDGDIKLDRGVHFDFEAGETRVEKVDARENVSLSGFSVEFDISGTPDPAELENTMGEATDFQAVKYEGAADGTVNDVHVIDGPSTAFEFANVLDQKADGLQAHGAFNKGGGGNGYAYELRESFDGQFTNLEDSGMRHSLLFASWRSNVDNEATVNKTDRDINYHGGQDHGNVVHVKESIRIPENDVMSNTLWYNQGGDSWGAITDWDANTTTFDYVEGTKREDVIKGSDKGVYFDGRGADDKLTGGAGDDTLKGGDGDDILDGRGGDDIALFDENYSDDLIRFNDDGTITIGDDTLLNMEKAQFGDNTVVDLSDGDTNQTDDPVTAPETSKPAPEPAPVEDTVSTGNISFDSTITSEWNDGYVVEVYATNETGGDIEKAVNMHIPADLDTVWGQGFTENSDGSYKIYDDDTSTWKDGETWRFKFKAYGDEKEIPVFDNSSESQDTTDIDTGLVDDSDEVLSFSGEVTSEWNDGYVAEMFVTNESDEAWENPVVKFELPSDIADLWNGNFNQNGDQVFVQDNNDMTLAPGESYRFKFKTYNEEAAVPQEVQLAGVDTNVDDFPIG